MDSEDRVLIGMQAKQLLDFSFLWEWLETECVDSWQHSDYKDTATREQEYARLVAIKDAQSVLNRLWENAQNIRAQEEREQQQLT